LSYYLFSVGYDCLQSTKTGRYLEGDLPVAVVDVVATSPVIYYVHTDHLGRPAA
jgi:hypothetical protein